MVCTLSHPRRARRVESLRPSPSLPDTASCTSYAARTEEGKLTADAWRFDRVRDTFFYDLPVIRCFDGVKAARSVTLCSLCCFDGVKLHVL